jgi:hypothetical protein
VSLAYLWRRDQTELLQEMIDCQMNSIVIKVATLGLDEKHLGQSLKQLQGHLEKMVGMMGTNLMWGMVIPLQEMYRARLKTTTKKKYNFCLRPTSKASYDTFDDK